MLIRKLIIWCVLCGSRGLNFIDWWGLVGVGIILYNIPILDGVIWCILYVNMVSGGVGGCIMVLFLWVWLGS